MPKRSSSRKSTKRRTKRKSLKVKRPFKGQGSLGLKDIHTFKETINAGQLIIPAGSTTINAGAVWRMSLTNFPAWQTLGSSFEFARLNKCTISYWPKSNMQTNLPYLPSSGVDHQGVSVSGTLITAIDGIPLPGATGNNPVQWPYYTNDSSNDSGVTFPAPFYMSGTPFPTCSYVRGIQNSKETELYKKQSRSFQPVFYDLIYDTEYANTVGTTSGQCFNAIFKKWINTRSINTSSGAIQTNIGPTYYGPMIALDVNQGSYQASTEILPLYDVRMTYSISFKRLKGY